MSLFSAFDQSDVWSLAGITFSSPISDILDAEDFTIEKLLVEDEILQEVKSRNSRLVSYLSSPDAVDALLTFLVSPADFINDSDIRAYKLPYVSCELVCCEIAEIIQSIVDDDQRLTKLFSILDQPPPLNSYLAGYFEKVLEVLLRNATDPMMRFINAGGQSLLDKFLNHVDNYSIMQIVQRLMLPHIPFHEPEAFESSVDSTQGHILCEWSNYADVALNLVTIMLQSTNTDITSHIADLLVTVIQLSAVDATILNQLCGLSIQKELCECLALDVGPHAVTDIQGRHTAILLVLDCLLSRLHETALSLAFDSRDSSSELMSTVQLSSQNVVGGLLNYFAKVSPFLGAMFPVVAGRLGPCGYYFVKLVESLVRLGNGDAIDVAICENGIAQFVVGQFFLCANHSMLHISVQRLLTSILDEFQTRSKLFSNILQECALPKLIISSIEEASTAPPARRPPNIGHIIMIAQSLDAVLKPYYDRPIDSVESADYGGDLNLNQLNDAVTQVIDLKAWQEFACGALATIASPNADSSLAASMASVSSPSQDPFEAFQTSSYGNTGSEGFAANWDDFPITPDTDVNATSTSASWHTETTFVAADKPDDDWAAFDAVPVLDVPPVNFASGWEASGWDATFDLAPTPPDVASTSLAIEHSLAQLSITESVTDSVTSDATVADGPMTSSVVGDNSILAENSSIIDHSTR